MEPVGDLLPANDTPGDRFGERTQTMAPLKESAMRRKRFSDITNIASSNVRSERSAAGEQEGPNLGHTKNAKDYIAMLLKENNALLRIVQERNKIIEISGTELQKLNSSLQNANQQNWQLAQANSQMLAELNLANDRLKALQHELGCTVAVLRAKTSELQEEKKLSKQYKKLREKIGSEANEAAVDPSHTINGKKPSNTNRKRMLRSRSLGPTTTVTPQETSKERDEGRRKSMMRPPAATRTELCEPTTGLFEIEDIKLPIRSHEDSHVGHTPCRANGVGRNETHDDQSASLQHQNQGSRRSSLGIRPMRRAAEKVNSYKEVPINVKMRRVD